MHAAETEEALRELALVRVAKDLFLTDWYENACRDLFSPLDCALFARIGDETRREREAALRLSREWSRGLDPAALEAQEVRRVTQKDFLESLILAKEASGRAFERIAFFAPIHMREDFLRLAAVDFRHAGEFRRLLVERVAPVPVGFDAERSE